MLDTAERQSLTLLSLPYDIRFLIYQHVFPTPPQIYLQALQDKSITAIIADGTIDTSILLTCRAVHTEAAGYLYNTYLFNLIGTKEDCLRSHKSFLQTLQNYARDEVHINAFSNGVHSDTMCISMHTGDGKTAILRGRRRGVETTLSEIREEIQLGRASPSAWSRGWTVGGISIVSLFAVMIGWLVQMFLSG